MYKKKCCEGVVYLTSLGRSTDIGVQLGKACYRLVAGKGRGGGGDIIISSVSSLSFLFLFLPCFSLASLLLSLFSLSLGDDAK